MDGREGGTARMDERACTAASEYCVWAGDGGRAIRLAR